MYADRGREECSALLSSSWYSFSGSKTETVFLDSAVIKITSTTFYSVLLIVKANTLFQIKMQSKRDGREPVPFHLRISLSSRPGRTSGTHSGAVRGPHLFSDSPTSGSGRKGGNASQRRWRRKVYNPFRIKLSRKMGVLRGWQAYGAKLHPGRHPLSVSLVTFCTSRK